MKRNYLSTLIMAVVFGGLIAWYLGYEKNLRPKQQAEEDKAKQLVTIKQEDVQELVLEKNTPAEKIDGKEAKGTPAHEIIKLKRTGSDWNITEPVQDLADTANVNQMLTAVTSTKYDRIVEDKPKDLEEYGLKVPITKISIRKADTAPFEAVSIGRDTPVGASVYARNDVNETVYKVSSTLKSGTNRTLKELRNKSIFNGVSRLEINEVEVQNDSGSMVLRKGAKEEWTIARDGLPADINEVTKLLNGIIDLRVVNFAAEDDHDLKTFGLKDTKLKAYLTKVKDKTRLAIWFGKVKEKVYAKREDRKAIYEVDKGILDKINRPASAYRSVELAAFNRFDIKQIKIEHGTNVLELLKGQSGWAIPNESKIKLDPAKVDGLLAHVQDSKIVRYADSKIDMKSPKAGLTSPKLVLRFFEKPNDKESVEKVVLSFGAKEGPLVYVSRAGLDIPFLVKEDDFKRLDVKKEDLAKAEEKPPAPKPADKKS